MEIALSLLARLSGMFPAHYANCKRQEFARFLFFLNNLFGSGSEKREFCFKFNSS